MDSQTANPDTVSPAELQEQVLGALRLLTPVKVVGFRKRRIGGTGDGGYVMLDDLTGIGVCYSLGVGPDVSWDVAMAQRGATVLQYDHTVAAPPADHPNCRHFKVGITHDEALSPGMRRIDTLLQENGHASRRDMVLKVDIEGHEWDSLSVLPSAVLGQFRQVLVELHGMRLLHMDSFRERAVALFDKLRLTHHCIHVHGNNFGGMSVVAGTPIADVLELTLVRREDYVVEPSDEVFPTALDGPNNTNLPDLFLGTFRFG